MDSNRVSPQPESERESPDTHTSDMALTMTHPGPVPSEAAANQAGTVVTEAHDAAFGN